MADRRKLKRRHLVYYLRVVNAETNRELGHVMDVTPDGLLVMSKHRVQVGRRLKLRMTLPGGADEEQRLRFEGVTVSTGKDVCPGFYDTGVKVKRLTRRDLSAIRSLLDDHGFRD